MIGGAKILRDRFEELHGASRDAEPAQEITEHASTLHAWTGTTPDPDRPIPVVEDDQRRWRFRNR
jgi:hypothetical protein